ncbi:MAG TPA: PilT/PilU family type 4a pilus ATPase [Vicinamibacteria bacterium]
METTTASSPSPAPATSPFASAEGLNRILLALFGISDKISDILFSPGKPPQVELNSQLRAAKVPGMEALSGQHTAEIARLLTQGHAVAGQSLSENGSADISYAISDRLRFRVNIFKQQGGLAVVMRVIPPTIPTMESLGLPDELQKIAGLKNGIVLVTGPTGSGKSSTLAAVIDRINENRPEHILTIEDPVEFRHKHKKGTVHQREVHTDTPNFALALRAALRQAPKVILVGEMRDMETIEVAFEAAETGHLVLSTLHTIDCAKTVDRVIGVFPKNEEQFVRTRLAQTFRYVVSQRLLPRADGKSRVAAIEVLKSTLRTREYIEKGEREGKSLVDAMNDGEVDGMQSFDRVLERMARNGEITVATALGYSTNRGNLRLNLHDIAGAEDD